MTIADKQTMVGIPKNWEIVSIWHAAEYINGRAFSPKDWGKKGLPIVRIQNLTNQNAQFNYYDKTVEKEFLLNSGDLLFSWSGTLGLYMWDRGRAILNQHIFKVIPKQNTDKKYLYYVLNIAINQLETRVHGSTMKHFKRGELESTFIPLPPLPEQLRIANILNTVDEAIRRSQRAIAETERFKAGVMQEMMMKGIGHTEFKEDPDVGMLPEEWDVVRLISVLSEKTKYGYSGMEVKDGSKVRVLTLSAVTKNDISVKNSKVCSHDPSQINEYWLKKDDIFIGRSNTRELVGLTAIYRGTESFAIFADLLIRVRADKTQITPDFLSYYLVSDYVRKYFAASSKGTSGSMKKIDTSIIEELKVSLPTLSEQHNITTILSSIDRKLTLQRQRTAHYENLKQGLMNKLLTGKRRVKVT